MIIHHQDGSKAVIEMCVKVVRTKQNKILMCFKSPATGARGIVEFQGQEVMKFLVAARSSDAIDDEIIFSTFARIKPHEA
jgi:hypothetical protein